MDCACWKFLFVCLFLFLLPAFTRLGHQCQDLFSQNGMHVCTDYTSVYTLIRKSFGGMETGPMLTPREKSLYLKKISSEENRAHGATSSRTVSPTHYQRAIEAPSYVSKCLLLSRFTGKVVVCFPGKRYIQWAPSWLCEHVIALTSIAQFIE